MSLKISMTLESYDEQHVGRKLDFRCRCELAAYHIRKQTFGSKEPTSPFFGIAAKVYFREQIDMNLKSRLSSADVTHIHPMLARQHET